MPPRRSTIAPRVLSTLAALSFALPALARAQVTGLHVKYVRDSEEYATLSRQVYRVATSALPGAVSALPRGAPWAVMLDVDETALDNSAYELERLTYRIPSNAPSWKAWVERGEAGAVPGVGGFIEAVRAAGGRVAWLSNRDEATREATRANLDRHGLWAVSDLLCLQRAADTSYTKARRRAEVAGGTGGCAWAGPAPRIVLFVGDAMGDFPSPDEPLGAGEPSGDAAFGSRFFLLPNPMYGRWVTAVTRGPIPQRVVPAGDPPQD